VKMLLIQLLVHSQKFLPFIINQLSLRHSDVTKLADSSNFVSAKVELTFLPS
jgi:hypothetical protein